MVEKQTQNIHVVSQETFSLPNRGPVFKFNLFFFETCFHHVAQAGLKLLIFLPQPSLCWGLQVCATISG
jgi:hypothetical protein